MFAKMQFVTDSLKNPLNKIKTSIRDIRSNILQRQNINITQIVPNKIFHIQYPNEKNIQSLMEVLKSSNQYQLWNISQYPYSEQIIQKLTGEMGRNSDGRQVIYNLTYEYFANIPFCEMIKSIECIHSFLQINQNNKVFIHCQQNKRRSAVFLSSYVFLTGIEQDIVSSILSINKALNVKMQDRQITQGNKAISSSSIYKSQHMVLKNLMNYTNNNEFINKKGWVLRKIMINNAPKIHLLLKNSNNQSLIEEKTNIPYKILLQIRSVQGLIYKKIFSDEFLQGQSICLRIGQNQKILLIDDFLIIIKYVHEKKGYSILRTQLNTNFIYDSYVRVNRQDMDLSIKNAHFKNQNIFMDITLQQDLLVQSQLSKLGILKDSGSLQNKISEQQKQTAPLKQEEENKQNEQNGSEEDFQILDQEQEAEHNQKMEKQIEQQLARQLANLRKKNVKVAQEQNNVSQQVPENKVQNNESQVSSTSFSKLGVSQNDSSQKSQFKQFQQFSGTNNNQQTEQKNQENFQKQNDKKQQNEENENENKQQKQQEKQQQKQDNEESQEEQNSEQNDEEEEQEEQEEEDLDAYLQKLQNQAQK